MPCIFGMVGDAEVALSRTDVSRTFFGRNLEHQEQPNWGIGECIEDITEAKLMGGDLRLWQLMAHSRRHQYGLAPP